MKTPLELRIKANSNLILIGVNNTLGNLLFLTLRLLCHIPMEALYELIEIFMADISTQISRFPVSPPPSHPPHTPYHTPWIH
jgi:hypothetical protein